MVAVVSQPDRPRGRGRHPSPSPVSAAALAAGVPLFRPERVSDPATALALRAARPDLGVVVAFGQFLPKIVRELPSLGYTINGHASLLPALRGAAPIARAILAGYRETGISVMRVEREMDAGPVARMVATPIGDEEIAGELEGRLAVLAAGALAEAIDDVAAERIRFTPQDDARATLAPKLTREETQLDFREPARQLVLRIRAFAPRPGATTTLGGEAIRILRARALPGPVDAAPGTARSGLRAGESAPLGIATGDGWLAPTLLQRAGGRALAVDDFLRGHAVAEGARFGGSTEAAEA